MARLQPEIPDGIPAAVKARLRQETPWNEAALMVYAMRHPALASWASVLFNAEQEGCPREKSDAFVRTIAVDLVSVVADGNVDPDGIYNAFQIIGDKRVNGWYDRRLDVRKVDDRGRIARNARYIQRLLRDGRVTQRDLAVEVQQNVPVGADRPLLEDMLRKATPTPQGRLNTANLRARITECGVKIDSWKPVKQSDLIKSRLGALRDEADAPRRVQEAAAREAAKVAKVRAQEAADAATAARKVEAARVAEAARQVVEEAKPVVVVEPPRVEPEVSEVLSPNKRTYVRRPKDLSPKTAPTVITNPSSRDVAAHELMVMVLAALGVHTGKSIRFIPSMVMQHLAASAFESYVSSPGVGITHMGYKGYVTNVGGIPAVWRVEPVVVDYDVVPSELRFMDNAGTDVVKAAYKENPTAFDAGIAMVMDERYTPYLPVDDLVIPATQPEPSSEAGSEVGSVSDDAVEDVRGDTSVDTKEAPVEIVAPEVPQPPAPAPVLDQARVDDAVQDALSRVLPGVITSLQQAMLEQVTCMAEELGHAHAARVQRVAEARKALEDAEQEEHRARLHEEAGKLLAAVVEKLARNRHEV